MAKPKTTVAKPKAAPKAKAAPKPKATPKPTAKAKSTATAKRKSARAAAPLEALFAAVQEVREGRRTSPRTARLIAAGAPKMAQKVVEEAAEVAIEAILGRREALIAESVDLFYNLAVLWTEAGVGLGDLWAEMERREAALGMSEQLPKTDDV